MRSSIVISSVIIYGLCQIARQRLNYIERCHKDLNSLTKLLTNYDNELELCLHEMMIDWSPKENEDDSEINRQSWLIFEPRDLCLIRTIMRKIELKARAFEYALDHCGANNHELKHLHLMEYFKSIIGLSDAKSFSLDDFIIMNVRRRLESLKEFREIYNQEFVSMRYLNNLIKDTRLLVKDGKLLEADLKNIEHEMFYVKLKYVYEKSKDAMVIFASGEKKIGLFCENLEYTLKKHGVMPTRRVRFCTKNF